MASISYPVNRKQTADPRLTSYTLPTGSAVDKINALESYYFRYNELAREFGYGRTPLAAAKQIGLIAQEIQAVEPSLVEPLGVDTGDEEYYVIDYQALNVLVMDALNELNQRADVIKTRLGMSVETYPARYTGALPSLPVYQITNITATPVNGVEGSSVTWTITGNNIPDNLMVPFKFTGNFNYTDISVSDSNTSRSGIHIWNPEQDTPELRLAEGDAFGGIVFQDGVGTLVIDYINDTQAEGTETITMVLKASDSLGNTVPALTCSATISDS